MVIATVVNICKSLLLGKKKAQIKYLFSSYNETKMITEENKQQKPSFDFGYIRSTIITHIHTILLLLYVDNNFLKK